MSQPVMLHRILAILDAATEGPVNRTTVARGTGLPKATTNRLIAALLDTGLLRETREGLILGHRLVALGHHANQAGTGLLDAAAPVMVDLHHATGQLVQLATLTDLQVTYLAKTHGRRAPRLNTSVGHPFPAHATGAGKALLAYRIPPVNRADLETSQLTRFTDATITDPEALLRDLRLTRRRGYAVDAEEFQADRSGVAVPITVRGHAVAALTLTATTTNLRAGPTVAALNLARQAIQSTLDTPAQP